MPWPEAFPRPTVTILMPIERQRGELLRAIDCWSSQDYPRELLDFVFVSNTSAPKIVAEVERKLQESGVVRGGIVHIRTTNEVAQYAYGARYARGEWLLVTEPHCVPQLDCVSELIGTLVARGLAGGCVRTLTDHSTNPYARIEERVFQEDFPNWSHDGDWRKFTKRGFALRRDVYRAIGGLEEQYGWFAEMVISARLAADGHCVGYVPTAAVQHFNTNRISDLFYYVRDYHRELARYAHEGSAALRPYLRGLGASSPSPPPIVAQAARRAVSAALVGGLCRRPSFNNLRLLKALIAARIEALFGRKWGLILRTWIARLRMQWLSTSQEQRYRLYQAAAGYMALWGLASYTPPAAPPTCAAAIDGGALQLYPGEVDAGLFGFHVQERHGGRTFRWTSPVASVMLDAPPGDYDLTLDVGGLIGEGEMLLAFCNGQELIRDDEWSFHLRRETMIDGSPQVLTLIAPPRWTRDARETRALGLPLFELRIAKLGRAKLRIAA